MALQIKFLSPKAYALLCTELPFPNINMINKIYQKLTSDIPEKLTNIKSIGDLVNLLKEKYEISKSEPITACLSTDALFLNQTLKLHYWICSPR